MDSQSNNPRIDEIVGKLQERPDIFEKLDTGDTNAITEIFNHLGANNFASDSIDVEMFDQAMKDEAPNIPWEKVQKDLGLRPR
jgi:hypothetical protein